MAKSDEVRLVLRLPKGLHGRLTKEAKRNGVSLNTQIINQLEGAPLLRDIIKATADEAASSMLTAINQRAIELDDPAPPAKPKPGK